MARPWLRSVADDVELDLLVVPGASRTEITGVAGDRLKVRIAAPPVEGKANKALIKALAKTLGVGRGDVEIASGHSGRRKLVRVRHCDCEHVLARLQRAVAELE